MNSVTSNLMRFVEDRNTKDSVCFIVRFQINLFIESVITISVLDIQCLTASRNLACKFPIIFCLAIIQYFIVIPTIPLSQGILMVSAPLATLDHNSPVA